MKIKQLTIKNFRNYTNQTVFFNDGLNLLIGNNAQGKTNMLEAVFLCSIGRSARTTKDKELIKFGCDYAYVNIIFSTIAGDKNIEIIISNNTKKTVKINGLPIKKIGELMEVFNTIYFSPDELKIVKDGPVDRRKFMDIDISQISKTYFYLLTRYDNILEQRNKLLKITQDYNILLDTISIWDTQLSEIGAKIIISRIKFIKKLNEKANAIHKTLTNNEENLELEYSGINGNSIEEIKKLFLEELQNSYEKDYSLKYTSVGPHRDDIKIKVNDIDIRSMGSQGQKRTVALSLKLAELEIFKDETNEYPILLLDDVLSELDENRRTTLLKLSSKVQTILTATEYNENIEPNLILKIKDGSVENGQF